MAHLLYRLGRFSYQRRRVMVVGWALLLALLGFGAVTIGGSTVEGFSVPGTESQRASDELRRDLPEAGGASLFVVVRAPAGQVLTSKAMRSAVATIVARTKALPAVVAVVDPYQSRAVDPTGSTGLITVRYAKDAHDLPPADLEPFDRLDAESPGGLLVVPGGVNGAPPEVGAAEAIGVAVAAVVLVVTFGSLVAAGMTLFTALIGVLAGLAGLFLGASVVDVSSTAPILALLLGLAVGIGYALFIGSRHRDQLADGMAPQESVARATATAGSGVLLAAATVIIALAGLALVGVPFLTVLGLAAAGTVLTAVLVALTLLPALLAYAGGRILPRHLRSSGSHAAPLTPQAATGFGFTWARWISRFRVPVVIGGVLLLAALAVPTRDLRLALPDTGTAPKGSPQRTAYDLASAAFGEGINGPLVVVVKGEDPAAIRTLTNRVVEAVQAVDDVTTVTPGPANGAGTTRLVQVIPVGGPTSKATSELVRRIRDTVRPMQTGGATVTVTGTTAIGVDVSAKLTASLPRYLLVVIGMSFLLMLVAFRSVLVPVKATVGFLLTIGATVGVTVAVFQWGWVSALFGVDRPGPLGSFLPIIMMGVLFGLAMNYEVFIVARVREEFGHSGKATEATIAGVGHSARVVTAAALIMAAVFGGFVLVGDPVVKTMAFGLSIGVLIDTFIVRMTLVPAVLTLIGDRAWRLPPWLDRITPKVDIEGEDLKTPPSAQAVDRPLATIR